MANPKRRHSKSRKNKRRSHHALTPVALHACQQCGQMKRSHRVCGSCGHYDKERKVVFTKE